jgi:hypothetical protein
MPNGFNNIENGDERGNHVSGSNPECMRVVEAKGTQIELMLRIKRYIIRDYP